MRLFWRRQDPEKRVLEAVARALERDLDQFPWPNFDRQQVKVVNVSREVGGDVQVSIVLGRRWAEDLKVDAELVLGASDVK